MSRVAQAVYSTGRQLERAECMARIVHVHADLCFEMPPRAAPALASLVAISGSEDGFVQRYGAGGPEEVLAFLVSDPLNPGSVLSALRTAREQLRAARSVMPKEAAEIVGTLCTECNQRLAEPMELNALFRQLHSVVRECQRVHGVISSTMTRDRAYGFLRTGYLLERADMTTRVLSVRAATLGSERLELTPFEDIRWMSVLKSLSAHQMYRPKAHPRVQGAATLRFVLQDIEFPRSIAHCLTRLCATLAEMPRAETALARCRQAQTLIEAANTRSLAVAGLDDCVSEVQRALDGVHEAIVEAYFAFEPPEHEHEHDREHDAEGAGPGADLETAPVN